MFVDVQQIAPLLRVCLLLNSKSSYRSCYFVSFMSDLLSLYTITAVGTPRKRPWGRIGYDLASGGDGGLWSLRGPGRSTAAGCCSKGFPAATATVTLLSTCKWNTLFFTLNPLSLFAHEHNFCKDHLVVKAAVGLVTCGSDGGDESTVYIHIYPDVTPRHNHTP